ncbi:LysR substrate-binding domain-containing protein [Leeia oryzae]|uniref:LysR substrate-binding domain-containing protein n=1 Tax=Leeia oryzae TaxID=356662 RepID=UPI0003675B89|nr:LysR substrate-binding domain-containing protein [Leeia oryzae]
MKNLPTDLLRTFVTVIDQGGFSNAGDLLGRSQPAISLQIKRLEELVNVSLFQRTSRSFQLSEEGQVLLAYARSILNLNDEVLARLSKVSLSGVVRLGVPNEFADSFLPDILGKFSQSYPDVTLEVGCELSTHLLAKLDKGEYDLVFGLHATRKVKTTNEGWSEELVWVGSPQHAVYSKSPLPLIVAPIGCVYRQRILETLEQLGRPWRIAYTSPSFGGIKAGVLAGLGVTVLARSAVPDGLRILGAAEKMPKLPDIRVHLHYDQGKVNGAVLGLIDFMSARLALTTRHEGLDA